MRRVIDRRSLLGIFLALVVAACQNGPTSTPTPVLPETPGPTARPPGQTVTPDRGNSTIFLPFVARSAPQPVALATPTRTPKPTPTPVPKWPEALAEPGRSKLGLHVIRNNSPDIMEFIRRTKSVVVKAVDDMFWLGEVKKESPQTLTIGRITLKEQRVEGDPVQAARAFVNEHLAEYQYNTGVDYWEGWNEPRPENLEEMTWYAQFEAERVRQMAANGLRAAVGGFAAGVPEWDEMAYFIPALQAAQRAGGIFTLHEYSAPTMQSGVGAGIPGRPAYPDRGPWMLRYRFWYEDLLKRRGINIPLVISEAGIDGGVIGPGARGKLGWKDFTNDRDYIRQLAWYDSQLQQDDYVLGFTVFTAGSGRNDQWESFDINNILPQLAYYVVSQR